MKGQTVLVQSEQAEDIGAGDEGEAASSTVHLVFNV